MIRTGLFLRNQARAGRRHAPSLKIECNRVTVNITYDEIQVKSELCTATVGI